MLPDVGLKLVVLVAIFWAFAIIAVGLRLWSRWIKRQALVFNDYAVLIALVFTSALAISNFCAVIYGGVGTPLLEVGMPKALVTVKIYVFVWLWQAFANTFARLSFLDLLRRIFKGPRFNIAVWVVFGASCAYMLGCFIALFASCKPFEAHWDPTAVGACGNEQMKFNLSAIFNFLLDLCIIILPMPMLWGLQMKTSRKIALTFVFMTGGVVCVMTLLRLQASLEFSTPESKANFTVTVFYDALWSSLEPSLAVVNCCLPLFPPVFKKMSDYSLIQSMISTLTGRSRASSGWSSKNQPPGYNGSGYSSRNAQANNTFGSGRNVPVHKSNASDDAWPMVPMYNTTMNNTARVGVGHDRPEHCTCPPRNNY